MNDSSNVASVVATLKVLQQQATRLQPISTQEVASPTGPKQVGFADRLDRALSSVNELQQASAAKANGFVSGEHQDLVGTMVAAQKASVAFEATLQTRNRLVSAYQDIMNMPI